MSENIKKPEEIMREMVFAEKKTNCKNNLRGSGKDEMGGTGNKEQGHIKESSIFQSYMKRKRHRNYDY